MKKTRKSRQAEDGSSAANSFEHSHRGFLRAVPTQDRSRRSVEHILSTAALLLDRVGLDGFNTNLLAKKADVRVRTVYRYFPDKYAVIVTLAHRMAAEWEACMDRAFLKFADPNGDWEAEQRQIIPLLVKMTAGQPGGLSVIKALGGIPELSETDFSLLERMSLKMSVALRRRGARLSPTRLQNVCRVVLVSTNFGVETYFRLKERERSQFLNEMVSMQIRYLRAYLQ